MEMNNVSGKVIVASNNNSSNNANQENYEDIIPYLGLSESQRKELPMEMKLKLWQYEKNASKAGPNNPTGKASIINTDQSVKKAVALVDRTNTSLKTTIKPSTDLNRKFSNNDTSKSTSAAAPAAANSIPRIEQHPKISGKRERKAMQHQTNQQQPHQHHQNNKGVATIASFPVYHDRRDDIAFDRIIGVVDKIDGLQEWISEIVAYLDSLSDSIKDMPEFKAVRDSLEKSGCSVKHSAAYLQADWDLFIQEAAQIQSALAETMQENETLHEQIKEMEDQQELLQLQIIQNNPIHHGTEEGQEDQEDDPMALSMDHNTPSSSSDNAILDFNNRYLLDGNPHVSNQDDYDDNDNNMITDCSTRQEVSCQTDASLDGLLLLARSMAFQSKILNDQNSEQARKSQQIQSELHSKIHSLEKRVDQLLQEKMLEQREHREFQDNILAMQQESMAGLKRAIEQKNQIQEMFETEKRRRIDIEQMYNDVIQEFYGATAKHETDEKEVGSNDCNQ